MNLNELQRKLIAVARAKAPGDGVPYAFEKRVSALLASRVAPASLDWWVNGLWRAAISSVALAILCGAWMVLTPATRSNSVDLSQDFENTLLASMDQADQSP
jgi:hypothetical protein